MSRAIACLCCVLFVLGAVSADDRVDEAYARLRAKQAAASQPASISNAELVKLQTELATLRKENARLAAEVTRLMAQVAELQKAKSSPAGAGSPGVVVGKKVVLDAREFAALPKGRQSKQPLGFTNVEIDAVGFINGALVKQVIDESTAIVEIALEGKDGIGLEAYGRTVNRRLVIEGLSTARLADDSGWRLEQWFKIVSTTKRGGTTYYVANPIVQADK